MSQVKKPNNKDTFIKRGDTTDIIKTVLTTIKTDDMNNIKAWAKSNFQSNKNGLKKLWHWVKDNVEYVEDPSGAQYIKTANRTYHERTQGTDCKSFTVLIVKCLEALNVPYTVRFTSYTNRKTPTHVYCIAHLNGQDIIMDAVYDEFNKQADFKSKIDFNMTNIHVLSGTPSIGGFGEWLRNGTLNKIAFAALYAFVPFEVKPGTRTARKIAKGKKVLKWFLKVSPFSNEKTINYIKKRITEKLKQKPEDYFLRVVKREERIGCIDGLTTMACIAGLAAIFLPVIKAIVNARSGADIQKEDLEVNETEMADDAALTPKGKIKSEYDTELNNKKDSKADAKTDTPEKGGESNNMPLLVGGAVAAFLLLKK